MNSPVIGSGTKTRLSRAMLVGLTRPVMLRLPVRAAVNIVCIPNVPANIKIRVSGFGIWKTAPT
jgi:hypothetical protein